MNEKLELKLLWCGVNTDDATALFSEDEATARAHALSGFPEGNPVVEQWVCVVRDWKAIPLRLASKWVDIDAAIPIP